MGWETCPIIRPAERGRKGDRGGVRLLLLWVLASAPIVAQQSLSLDGAVEIARKSHPALQASAGRVAAGESGIVQARLRPNPRLFVQTENWRAWSHPGLNGRTQTDSYAYLSQPIETGGKRAQRTAVAGEGLLIAQLERELAGVRVVMRVKQAYWSAATAARVHQAMLEDIGNFRQIVDYHEARVREGAMPEGDLLKVRLEGERLALTANTAQLEAERARIELFRAMGQTEFPEVRLLDALDAPASVPAADVASALAGRVEVRIAQARRQHEVANAALQRALAKPDVDALFGYKRTEGFNTVLAGLQWNLPLLHRNQGNIGAADAGVRIAESDLAATEAAVRAEVRAAETEVRLREKQVSGTLPKLMAQAGESAHIALAAYREGGADLLRLLDAQRVRIEIETIYYRTLGEYRQSIVALETALGVSQ